MTCLQVDTSNFWVLNWYYIIAVVLSGTGVVFAIRNFYKKKKLSDEPIYAPVQNSNSSISIVNNIAPSPNNISIQQSQPDIKTKSNIKILFIDDNHADYKMVSILKKSGWTNTKGVKDILDLDNYLVLESDIIFVDINGVGSSMFEDQGLGLASALKNKHPQKKIVLYSAETFGNRFHKALREVDACLQKNAEPYQFIDLVQSLTKIS